MKRFGYVGQLLLLGIGVFFSLATSAPQQEDVLVDDTWVLQNIFDGQTAVAVTTPIDLRIGWDDFSDSPTVVTRNSDMRFVADKVGAPPNPGALKLARNALKNIQLKTTNGATIPFNVTVKRFTSRIVPTAPLDSGTPYTLDLYPLRPYLKVPRPVPSTVSFSTAPVIHVLDVWQNNDTVIISFSAPIDETTITLSPLSIDFLWEENGELYSLASDTNTQDYLYETNGNLFMITSHEQGPRQA
ncbi:MAG: hypothetical protein JXR76_27830 [Deltaproteobacteria bacterium]|nr:hypothetical protein [Deltaproteobacteria bacterium]